MLLGPRKLLGVLDGERRSVLRTENDLLPIRELLANMLAGSPSGSPTVIMEKEEMGPGDKTYTAKFLRLVRERNVRSFFIVWPYRSQMNGLDVEFGHILGALEREDLSPDDVSLFVEEGVVRMDENGLILGHAEQGNRTFYYEDFLAYNCPYYTWRTLKALFANVNVAGAEHLERHVKAAAARAERTIRRE